MLFWASRVNDMGTKNISVSSGIVYEKVDKCNWMRVPKYSQVDRTSYLDVHKATIDTKRLGVKESKRPTVQQMLAKIKQP